VCLVFFSRIGCVFGIIVGISKSWWFIVILQKLHSIVSIKLWWMTAIIYIHYDTKHILSFLVNNETRITVRLLGEKNLVTNMIIQAKRVMLSGKLVGKCISTHSYMEIFTCKGPNNWYINMAIIFIFFWIILDNQLRWIRWLEFEFQPFIYIIL
jgi:hypothetical protein